MSHDMLRSQRCVCLLTCCLLAMPGCSEERSRADADGDGSMSADEAADGSEPGGDAGTGGSDGDDPGWTPGVSAECAEGEIPCRGACLSAPGEVRNACEIVVPGQQSLWAMIGDGDSLLATTYDGKIVRIALADFSVTALAELDEFASPREPLQIADGYLYFAAPGDGTQLPELRCVPSAPRQSCAGGAHRAAEDRARPGPQPGGPVPMARRRAAPLCARRLALALASGSAERLVDDTGLRSHFGYRTPQSPRRSLASGGSGELAALDYRSGEVELIDNAYARGASEDDRYFYVLRQGALLRLSR